LKRQSLATKCRPRNWGYRGKIK